MERLYLDEEKIPTTTSTTTQATTSFKSIISAMTTLNIKCAWTFNGHATEFAKLKMKVNAELIQHSLRVVKFDNEGTV